MYNFLYLLVTLKLLYPYFNIYFSLADKKKKKKAHGKTQGFDFPKYKDEKNLNVSKPNIENQSHLQSKEAKFEEIS